LPKKAQFSPILVAGKAAPPDAPPSFLVRIANVMKAQGYSTGQFGKNHLGDRDEHLLMVRHVAGVEKLDEV
jgi:arylsulfatase A-like enzyme